MSQNLGIDTKIKSLRLTKQNLQICHFSPLYLILIRHSEHKWRIWPLRSIWGVWQWYQWISHVPKPGDRHQNQVSMPFQTKVRNLAIFSPLYLILISQNDHKWQLWPLRSIWGVWQWSQWISHVPKHGDRHQNQVSKQKLWIWPFSGIFGFLYLNEIDVRGLKTLSYLDNFGCEHLSQ